MTWKPEGTVGVKESESTKLEWLLRNLRKLSQWSSTRVKEGSGKLFLSTPLTLNLLLPITYQKLAAFDEEIKGIDVIIDKPNHRIAIKEPGRWELKASIIGTITPTTANAAQTVEVAIYNETKGVASTPGVFTVPRYGEVFTVSSTTLVEVPFKDGQYDVGDYLSLWIRQRNLTPAIFVEVLEALALSAFRVSP